MKFAWALVFLATCALLVVGFQALQQEVNIRGMNKIFLLKVHEIKTMESDIIKSKDAMQRLNNELAPLDKQKNELKKNKDNLVKEKETSEQNLNTCQTQKTEADQQKSALASEVNIINTNREGDVQKLQQEIETLQKQIQDRDAQICVYVDKKNEEGRTLCDNKTAPSKQ